MKYLHLVWFGLWRKPLRSTLTLLALAVGFLLFGLLQGVSSAFDAAIERQRVDRLLVDSRFNTAPLPVGYGAEIEKVPGVTRVAWTVFLPGYYRERKNNLVMIGSVPSRFFAVRGEFQTRPEYVRAMEKNRMGVIVLESLAQAQGWRIGDPITLKSPFANRDGSQDWTFQIVGFLTSPENPQQFGFGLMNYEYYDELRAKGQGTVGRFVVRIANPRRSAEIGNTIDKLFANSASATRTQSENAIAQTQLATVGDVEKLTRSVILAVFFSILFLNGNGLLQSVRERARELATLKALGYSATRVTTLLFMETLVLCCGAALLGLLAAASLFPAVSRMFPALGWQLTGARFTAEAVLWTMGFAVALALLSASIPTWLVMRTSVVRGLAVR